MMRLSRAGRPWRRHRRPARRHRTGLRSSRCGRTRRRSARSYRARRALRDEKWAGQVDPEYASIIRPGHRERTVVINAGVVDDHVDATPDLVRPVDHALYIGLERDVGDVGERAIAQRPRNRPTSAWCATRPDDGRALGVLAARDGLADATPPPVTMACLPENLEHSTRTVLAGPDATALAAQGLLRAVAATAEK